MKLLVDNNLPPALGRGLGAMFADDHEVIHIKDKFGTGSLSDEDWIERLAAEGGWSVLSGDRRIATKRPSRELFLRARLVGFFPQPAVMKLPLPRLAARVLTVWHLLETTAGTMQQGCFEIGPSSRQLRGL